MSKYLHVDVVDTYPDFCIDITDDPEKHHTYDATAPIPTDSLALKIELISEMSAELNAFYADFFENEKDVKKLKSEDWEKLENKIDELLKKLNP